MRSTVTAILCAGLSITLKGGLLFASCAIFGSAARKRIMELYVAVRFVQDE